MNKQEILERVNFDLDKAKAVHQWLTEGETAQSAAQPTTDGTDPDGISIHADENGEKWVRVKIHDEDFLVAAHDYKEDETDEFKWQDAMDAMSKIGRKMWTKKQMHLVAAYIDEINAKLIEIGGEELDGHYWSSTEYNSSSAWYVNFSYGFIYYYSKYDSFIVRPCAAFKN